MDSLMDFLLMHQAGEWIATSYEIIIICTPLHLHLYNNNNMTNFSAD